MAHTNKIKQEYGPQPHKMCRHIAVKNTIDWTKIYLYTMRKSALEVYHEFYRFLKTYFLHNALSKSLFHVNKYLNLHFNLLFIFIYCFTFAAEMQSRKLKYILQVYLQHSILKWSQKSLSNRTFWKMQLTVIVCSLKI